MALGEVINRSNREELIREILLPGMVAQMIQERREPIALRRVSDLDKPKQVLFQLPPKGMTWDCEAIYSDVEKMYIFKDSNQRPMEPRLVIFSGVALSLLSMRIKRAAEEEGERLIASGLLQAQIGSFAETHTAPAQ